MIVGIVLTFVFAIAYYLLLRKYRLLWQALPLSDVVSQEKSVTIVVPFRNEEQALPALLQSFNALNTSFLSITYCFVDDHSTDKSNSIVQAFLAEKNGILLSLEAETGKKAAVQLAWQHSSTDFIVQTDADCIVQCEWLQHLIAPFQNYEIQLVSGPVQFKEENEFWKKVVALDFAGLVAIGAAHIAWQKPMICNGANLAYRKTAIQKSNLNTSKASGEDVFLLESVAHNLGTHSIYFCKKASAIVYTKGPETLREFWHQRLRWASKNGDYKNRQNLAILMFVWLYNLAIVVAVLTFNPFALTAAGFLIVVKLQEETKFYTAFTPFFALKDTSKNLILGQPFHICYMAFLPLFSLFLKYQWKERVQK